LSLCQSWFVAGTCGRRLAAAVFRQPTVHHSDRFRATGRAYL